MTLICTFVFALNVGSVNMPTRDNIAGKLLAETENHYLVDFSGGLKQFKLAGKASDYSRELVEKSTCVKAK